MSALQPVPSQSLAQAITLASREWQRALAANGELVRRLEGADATPRQRKLVEAAVHKWSRALTDIYQAAGMMGDALDLIDTTPADNILYIGGRTEWTDGASCKSIQ